MMHVFVVVELRHHSHECLVLTYIYTDVGSWISYAYFINREFLLMVTRGFHVMLRGKRARFLVLQLIT